MKNWRRIGKYWVSEPTSPKGNEPLFAYYGGLNITPENVVSQAVFIRNALIVLGIEAYVVACGTVPNSYTQKQIEDQMNVDADFMAKTFKTDPANRVAILYSLSALEPRFPVIYSPWFWYTYSYYKKVIVLAGVTDGDYQWRNIQASDKKFYFGIGTDDIATGLKKRMTDFQAWIKTNPCPNVTIEWLAGVTHSDNNNPLNRAETYLSAFRALGIKKI